MSIPGELSIANKRKRFRKNQTKNVQIIGQNLGKTIEQDK